jgi:hypothetical protein
MLFLFMLFLFMLISPPCEQKKPAGGARGRFAMIDAILSSFYLPTRISRSIPVAMIVLRMAGHVGRLSGCQTPAPNSAVTINERVVVIWFSAARIARQ